MLILFFSFCFRFAIRYALIASPVPGWRFWRYCLLYEILVLSLLFAFQLDLFCLNFHDSNKPLPTAYPSKASAYGSGNDASGGGAGRRRG